MMAYSNRERIETEEAELAALEEQYRKENGENVEPVVSEEAPLTPEEKKEEETWKKRHSDLRSYTQKQINDLNKQIATLQKEIQTKTNESKFPVNKQEAEDWVKEYPDLARVIGTLIDERSELKINSVADEVRDVRTQLEAERVAMARERALNKVLETHSDFLELINQDDFKQWVEDQPKVRGPRIGQAFYDALYNNETDAASAIEAVNQYKKDKGIERTKSRAAREVAASVTRTSAASPPSTGERNTFKESDIEKMKPWEYDRLEEEIEKARREGKIVYDLSGAAR